MEKETLKQSVQQYEQQGLEKSYFQFERETLEEAMNQNGYHESDYDKIWREGVEFGTKWQAEQDKNKYSDEEVLDVLREFYKTFDPMKNPPETSTIPLWFEQIKKK